LAYHADYHSRQNFESGITFCSEEAKKKFLPTLQFSVSILQKRSRRKTKFGDDTVQK
jgi:hypothetical protein